MKRVLILEVMGSESTDNQLQMGDRGGSVSVRAGEVDLNISSVVTREEYECQYGGSRANTGHTILSLRI